MKVIRFMLAIYVLFLALSPCSDSDSCVDERKADSEMAANEDHDHTSDEQESCTPFCICSGCATHIQIGEIAEITFTRLTHNTHLTTLYREKPVLDNGDAIWQPPRI